MNINYSLSQFLTKNTRAILFPSVKWFNFIASNFIVMKRTFIPVIILLFAVKTSFSQQIIHACCDTFVCLPGTAVSLTVTVDSGNTGTLLTYPDDIYTSVIDLGFSF